MSATLAGWGPWAYLVLFAVSAGESSAFLGLVVPGEAFVVLAGALVARGDLALLPVLGVVAIGAAVGDSIGYALGRRLGGCRDDGWLARIWSCRRMSRVRRFLDRHGPSTIFTARFVGMLRPLAPFAAGAVAMPYRSFLIFNVLGAAAWAGSAVGIGYLFGQPAERFLGGSSHAAAAVIVVTAIVAIAVRRRREARCRRDDQGAAGPARLSVTTGERHG